MKKVIQVIVCGGVIQDVRSNFKLKDKIYTRVIDYDNEPDNKEKNFKYSLMWKE